MILTMRDVMATELPVLSLDDPLAALPAVMTRLNLSEVPVVSADRLVGVITRDDAFRPMRDPQSTRAVHRMRPPAPSVAPHTRLADACALAAYDGRAVLYACDETGRLVGAIALAVALELLARTGDTVVAAEPTRRVFVRPTSEART
jgi:CBS domain-containing protein